jgi:hypothetical protein
VVKGLIEGDKYWATTDDGNRVLGENGGKKSGGLAGTSNVSVCREVTDSALIGIHQVYLAMRYGLRPVGTIAHEWIMAMGAKEDYASPNIRAMDAWEKGKCRMIPSCIWLTSV